MILAFLWNLLSKSINTKQFFDMIEFSLRRQSRLLRIDCSLNINGHGFRQMNTFPSFVIKWSLKVFRSNIRGTPHRYLEPTQTRNDHLIALYAHGIDIQRKKPAGLYFRATCMMGSCLIKVESKIESVVKLRLRYLFVLFLIWLKLQTSRWSFSS